MNKQARFYVQRIKDVFYPNSGRSQYLGHLRGEGIELGALCHPLDLSTAPHVRSIKYVDRYRKAELLQLFPELHAIEDRMVDADYICDLTHGLTTFADGSTDFIIANHIIEHLPDPISFLEDIWRVLKVGGVCYLGVPDRRFTFDRERPVTSVAHLRDDYQRRVRNVEDHHLEEFLRLCDRRKLPEDPTERAEFLEHHRQRSIHVHVWEYPDFLKFLAYALPRYAPFALVDLSAPIKGHNEEMLFILRKLPSRRMASAARSAWSLKKHAARENLLEHGRSFLQRPLVRRTAKTVLRQIAP